MSTTTRECVEALREAAEILGESPTRAEYEDLDLLPSGTTIMRVMGGWNDAKREAGLETYDQSTGGPSPEPKPDHVDIPDDVEWEELSGYMRWYYKNPQREIDKKDRRREQIRRWLHEQKHDRYDCVRCGEGDPACLDFHHVGDKEMSISKMITDGYGQESIEAEIEKCVVLCANCHRKEHYEPPNVEPKSQD
jgi:hypothetical protein